MCPKFCQPCFPLPGIASTAAQSHDLRTFFLASRHCLHFQRFSLRCFLPGPVLPSSPSFPVSSLDPSPCSGSPIFRNMSDVPPGVGDRRRGSTISRVESAIVLLSRYSHPSSNWFALDSDAGHFSLHTSARPTSSHGTDFPKLKTNGKWLSRRQIVPMSE